MFKKIPCTIIIAFAMFMGLTLRSHAYYTETFLYNGASYPYTLVTEINLTDTYISKLTFDKPVYAFGLVAGNAKWIHLCSRETFVITQYDTVGNVFSKSTCPYSADYKCASWNSLMSYNSTDIPIFVVPEAAPFINAFDAYFVSSEFVEIVEPIPVDDFNARSDDVFALLNPRADVVNGVLTCSWDIPWNTPSDVDSMPLLVDLVITDRDSGVRGFYSYPMKSSLPGARRLTFYDVADKQLQFSLAKVENLPSNFRIEFVNLTPYYVQYTSTLGIPITYKGQTSMIQLGYDGTFNGVVQILPDNPIPDIPVDEPEWNLFVAISNFFGGFFNNLGNLLKNLFIPSKEQFTTLFNDMQTFFSEKLGFLWFPFDFAIEIVTALNQGYADSIFEVPPISINILGGIDLYQGGSFDMDSTGIFVYVRFFTSVALACGTLNFAIKKWDEFMKGEFG